MTDTSNKEQVIVCLRWVDEKLIASAHGDFIGLHHVDDIKTNTIVQLKDTILQMNLNLSMCMGQCYNSAANMKKADAPATKNSVACRATNLLNDSQTHL